MFQSTPLHEGRLFARVGSVIRVCFNPRPYMRGDNIMGNSYSVQGGFNPRPYMRGDILDFAVAVRFCVSIHAPT